MNAPKFQFLIVFLFLLLFSKSNCQDSPWENIGTWMGYVYGMAMDNAQPDTVYAATQYGLYKSVDGAENWELLNLPMMEIKTIAVSQSHPNNLLCSSEFKAYRSDDYGNTWDTIFSDTMRIMSVIFNPENPATVLIGSDAQYTINGWEYEAWSKWINISYDGGETWVKLPFTGVEEKDSPRTVKYITMDPSDTSKIYIGSEGRSDGGLLISHDYGASWVYKQLANRSEEILALTCTPANYENHTVCAIVKAGAIDLEFYISRDSGLTWMESPPPLQLWPWAEISGITPFILALITRSGYM